MNAGVFGGNVGSSAAGSGGVRLTGAGLVKRRRGTLAGARKPSGFVTPWKANATVSTIVSDSLACRLSLGECCLESKCKAH
jgi:hypothetical protein